MCVALWFTVLHMLPACECFVFASINLVSECNCAAPVLITPLHALNRSCLTRAAPWLQAGMSSQPSLRVSHSSDLSVMPHHRDYKSSVVQNQHRNREKEFCHIKTIKKHAISENTFSVFLQHICKLSIDLELVAHLY